ncbi:MAG: hypothetical protein KF802_16420 [Bdellovibrionaceae bacterium]|nr:hypothetical protein [Pseudobdellovibrionaceae bacterium]
MQKTLQERLRGQHALCRGMSPVFLYDEAADALDALQSDLSKAVEALKGDHETKPLSEKDLDRILEFQERFRATALGGSTASLSWADQSKLIDEAILCYRAREAINHLTRDKG